MRKTVLASALAGLTLSASSYGQVYDIEVLPINDLALNSFAQSIDNSGNVTVVTQNLFNQVIDPALLDFDSLLLNTILTDPDSSQAGNFNDTDYQLIIEAIRSSTESNSSFTQKLATFRSFEYDGQTTTELPAFDVFSRAIDQLTQSNEVVVRDSEAGNFFVGTSDDGFESFEFTSQSNITSQFVLNDFRNLAFVQFGDDVTPLLPPEQTLGGLSDAYSINSSLQVAGSGGAMVATGVTASVALCEDEDTRGDIPESLCLWQLNYPSGSDTGLLQTTGSLLIRPIVWSVDGSGNLVDTEVFRLLDEEEDNTIIGTGEAVDINDGGIAVGYSEFGTREAAMFFNGQTSRILTQGDFLASDAMAINNNNFVAGTFIELGDTGAVTKMFVTNIESSEVDEPVGFFTTSTTVPRDMNNENIVVGQGVVDVAASDVPQTEAFIYDISTEVFTNLNDLIECNSPYTLINASGINDNGEIAVTARASLPFRNELGESLLDETGSEILVDTSVALKLTPIPNGQPQNCNEQDDDFERQGASITTLGLFSFVGLIGFRRLRRKWN